MSLLIRLKKSFHVKLFILAVISFVLYYFTAGIPSTKDAIGILILDYMASMLLSVFDRVVELETEEVMLLAYVERLHQLNGTTMLLERDEAIKIIKGEK